MSSASGSANPEFPVEAKTGFRPDGGHSVDEWIKKAGRLTFEDSIAR